MKHSSEVNQCSQWVCVIMLPLIPNQNRHNFVLSVKNSPCKQILQKVPVGNLSPLSFWPHFLSPRWIWLQGHFFWFLFIPQKREWWKFWIGSPWLYVNMHFVFNINGDHDSRYKVMESQDQVSRWFVDDGAISLHLWDHRI